MQMYIWGWRKDIDDIDDIPWIYRYWDLSGRSSRGHLMLVFYYYFILTIQTMFPFLQFRDHYDLFTKDILTVERAQIYIILTKAGVVLWDMYWVDISESKNRPKNAHTWTLEASMCDKQTKSLSTETAQYCCSEYLSLHFHCLFTQCNNIMTLHHCFT